MSEALNFDFGSKSLDDEFTEEQLAKISWTGFRERVVALSGKDNPTVGDFVEYSRG
ncbi:hypothetical protein [Salipiger thiooxidans]|uniref:hypothetical protein n=1 Tax=Salipiger thiooxidans TaxID=282683 RepID=UPI001CD732D0|nr:hypothetical protein [Salipiger thiooxidans]MCA0849774.1 hypothetical protein [Salipiger thiooxidans]